MADWQNGIFALPCGADFPGAFADGLIARMRARPAVQRVLAAEGLA